MAKPTKLSSFIQIKDGWLGEQGLINSKKQTRVGVANYEEEIKASMVHVAVGPGFYDSALSWE